MTVVLYDTYFQKTIAKICNMTEVGLVSTKAPLMLTEYSKFDKESTRSIDSQTLD